MFDLIYVASHLPTGVTNLFAKTVLLWQLDTRESNTFWCWQLSLIRVFKIPVIYPYYVDGYLGGKVSHINNLRSMHFYFIYIFVIVIWSSK